MQHLEQLIDSIVARVNVNLRNPAMDVGPLVKDVVPRDNHSMYYAFYALTSQHPLHFKFSRCSLSGTYFLGCCEVDSSILYKTDVRGDELKPRGSIVTVGDTSFKTIKDEVIRISHSYLIKTLVHNNSHDPENPEVFKILNTVSMHFANIHGTSCEGCFIAPFASVDLSTMHDCVVGEFSYVQAGELSHERIEKGRIWVKAEGLFEFNYVHDSDVVDKYISTGSDGKPEGVFMDFLEDRKPDFVPVYTTIGLEHESPDTSLVSPYAVVKGNNTIGENVLIAQRAYIEDSVLGKGANAQEHCYIVNSTLEGENVTAHGGKIINCQMGTHVFVGFNSFLRGQNGSKVTVGKDSIVMPHTIIDAEEPIEIPAGSLVWGCIRRQSDLELSSIALEDLAQAKALSLGNMTFQGLGSKFVEAFRHRIDHILEENGAFYDGSEETKGHAQKTQNVSYNVLQPYQDGEQQGMYPPMTIGRI